MVRGLRSHKRPVLLISECQNGIVNRAFTDPPLSAQVEARGRLPKIDRLADVFRAAGLPVVHCTITLPRASAGIAERGRGRMERNGADYSWLAAERGMSDEFTDRESSQAIPLHRRGDPDEMAAHAAFLCSEAAGGISGQSIPVAGGATRHIF